jgi:ribosomal protein S18 acetylase RimI-like enzyme
VDIVAFTDDHVGGAATVLAERHARHLAGEPLLARPTDFSAQVEREREDATGVAAVDHGDVLGYLLGQRREDSIGPHVWSYVAGHAVRDPELVRDLYAKAADRWLGKGLTRHFVYVPALRDLVEPWLRLSFGISAALGARDTAPETAVDGAVSVRPSTPDDLRDAARLDRTLMMHLTESPSFSGLEVESEEWFVDDWRTTWDEEQYTHFVADQGGEIVGHLLLYRRQEGDLRVPPHSIDLANALTETGVRGSGVGVALTSHALTWAYEHGFQTMITDWRMTNLEASRFWPRRGFRETFLRLYRSIP